jgi:hypothetical protein
MISKTRISKTGPIRYGMALFEILVVLIVLPVVLIAIFSIFNTITRQWKTQVSRGQAIRIANLAMAEMTKELRSGVSFNSVDGTRTSTFIMPANKDASGTFTLVWNTHFIAYASGYRVHYYLSDLTGTAATGTVLWRETNPLSSGSTGWVRDSVASLAPGSLSGTTLTASARGNVDNVASLTFTTGTVSDTVQATISISYKEGKITSVYTLSRLIYLSNNN